jgi:hypothetical protein
MLFVGAGSAQNALRGGFMVESGFALAIAVLTFIGTLIVAILTITIVLGIIFLLLAVLVGFMLRISILEALRILTRRNK